MALHRAEQVAAAMETALTGLATTGANVLRGRVKPHEDGKIPALSVFQGPDVPAGLSNSALQDWALTIHVDAHVVTSSEQVDTALNQIRKEVAVKLRSYTPGNLLGLAFVLDIEELPTGDPELYGDGQKPAAALRMDWKITYRRSYTDPSS